MGLTIPAPLILTLPPVLQQQSSDYFPNLVKLLVDGKQYLL